MLRKITVKLPVILILLFTIAVSRRADARPENETSFRQPDSRTSDYIQIINSYGYDNDWPRTLAVDIKKDLGKILPGVPVENHFTEINRIQKTALSREKIKSVLAGIAKPRVLVLIGEEAWLAYNQVRPAGWNTVPVVLAGIGEYIAGNDKTFLNNNPDSTVFPASSLPGSGTVTGIYLNNNTKASLDLISELAPEIKNILYISEETREDRSYIEEIEKYISERQNGLNLMVAKTGRSDIRYLQSLVSELNRPNTVVLINNFHSAGNPNEKISLSDRSVMPIFLLKDHSLYGNGLFMGGVYESADKYAEEIARLVKDVYENRTAVPFRKSEALHTVLNNKALGKYRLSPGPSLKYTGINTRDRKISSRVLILTVISAAGIVLFLMLLTMNLGSRRNKKKLDKELGKYSRLFEDYKLIYGFLPIGIVFFDENGNLLQSNPEAERLLKNILPFSTAEMNLFDSPLADPQTRQAIREGKNTDKNIELPSGANEQISYYRVILMPLPTSKNKEKILMLLTDNTKPYAERKFRERINEILKKAIDNSRLGIAEFNIAGDAGTATDAWYINLGVDKRTPVRESFRYLDKESREKVEGLLNDISQNKTVSGSTDLKVNHPDGSSRWVRLNISLKNYHPETGRIICGALVMNIDSQKQREEQLTISYEKILQTTRIKNSFISNLSHEIRTPLNAVVGFAELLIETADEQEQKELLKYIDENNENLLRTVTDIIDLSKIESHTAACPLTELDLRELCTELAEQMKRETAGSGVPVLFRQTESCIVFSNKSRLKQILEKFLDNAVKFTQEGSIEIGYKQQNHLVYLFVKDTGPGIPPEKQGRLFNRFEKMDNDYRGLGLGLPMAASIAKNLLKGNIGFESQAGKGTVMWITIPSGHIKMQPQMGIKDKLENATMNLEAGLKTILIAEDNENNYQLLKYILKGKFKLIHAGNGQEAVDLFKEHSPDLILMDIKMPVMDGYQATAAIRNISSDIPVLAVTAYAFDQAGEQASSGMFNQFITKPIREQDLMKAINTYLK